LVEKMKKIVIVGATGQLGSDCVEVLAPKFEIVPVGSKDLDITSRTAVEDLIGNEAPQMVLNCAAFTGVDDCETKRELARKVNGDGPANLAMATEKVGAQLIHISTDYVFDGRKRIPEPYTEADQTNPVSCYGVTKLAGEDGVKKATDKHMILRTAWLYGIRGRNFLKTMLKLAMQDPQREIKVVNDQYGSPTWSYRLAEQIARLIESGGCGIYHATSEGYGTWYELATDFLDSMDIPHRVVPCTTKQYPTPAERPANSILENVRLKAAGVNLMPDWKIDLDQFVVRFKDRLIDETKEGL
jgi:dTDP-4-dehydrorhamnose reductase